MKLKNHIMFTALLAVGALLQRVVFLVSPKKSPATPGTVYYNWKQGYVAYHVTGNGKPLLLLHNTLIGASALEWEKNIGELSQKFQVYAVDLPGFGQSQKPCLTYTAYQYTLFINDFIENVIGKPTSIIASSESCDFAVMACYLKPDNFRRMLLISPTGIQPELAKNKDEYYKRLLQSPIAGTQLFLNKSTKKAIASMLRHEAFFAQEKVTDDLINSYYYYAHIGGENSRFAYASTASKFTNVNIINAFKCLKTPFLVAWGSNNTQNTIENMSILEALRPRGEYAIFDNTRILPHYENSTEFNKSSIKFLYNTRRN